MVLKIIFVGMISIFFLLSLNFSRYCFGDTLSATRLPKNAKLIGKTLELKNNVVSFLCDDGSIANVKWQEITSLDIEDKIFAILDTNEAIMGPVSLEGGKLYVISPSLGKVELAPQKIVALQRKRKEIEQVFTVSPSSELASLRAKGTERPTQAELKETMEDNSGNKQEDRGTKTKQEGQSKTIGDKPSERIPEEMFLREEKVLIPKGKGEIEINLLYLNRDISAPLLGPDKVRSLTPSITGRYGITNNWLGFITVPYVINWRELQLDVNAPTKNFKNYGLGDISFGTNFQLLNEGAKRPSVMLSLSAVAPTGKSPYIMQENLEPIGKGHWQLIPGVSIVKTIDPVVLFGSLYYAYIFPASITQQTQTTQNTLNQSASDEADQTTGTATAAQTTRGQVKPGDSVNLVFGTGFALNEKVALSFKVLGSFILRDKLNRKEVGEFKTPFYFYSIIDYMLFKHGYIEPSVAFGMTKDATDFLLSLSYVHKFY